MADYKQVEQFQEFEIQSKKAFTSGSNKSKQAQYSRFLSLQSLQPFLDDLKGCSRPQLKKGFPEQIVEIHFQVGNNPLHFDLKHFSSH